MTSGGQRKKGNPNPKYTKHLLEILGGGILKSLFLHPNPNISLKINQESNQNYINPQDLKI